MNYYDYRDYFRQIIDLLESLISKFDAWTASVTGFWNTLLSFLPTALWFLVLLVGVALILKLFFPRWRDV
jgi:uncharacterized protein (DUF608 family)